MSMWKLGSSQCFTTPEISAGFSTHETLDISLDVGSLAEKVLKDLISTSEQLPVCIQEKKYCLDIKHASNNHVTIFSKLQQQQYWLKKNCL